MIISRTPFRVSFFGGGTDYPGFYRENGGAVLATSINKYCYINVRYLPPFFDYNYRIRYAQQEYTQLISEINHPSVRESLKFMGVKKGVEIQHNADVPAMAGLGSSSSFTVGLLNCLYALIGRMSTKRQLALKAIYIEQEMIKENVGSQDQTTAAFGGFNKIEFGGPNEILVTPIIMPQEQLRYFQDHFMLFFTGFSRMASEIAGEQIKAIPKKQQELFAMKDIVEGALSSINKYDFDQFGKLLHEQWKIKKSMTSLISNSNLDEIYEEGLKGGALGGKLLGAGGGGFMLFFVNPNLKKNVRERLQKLIHVPFAFENLGSQIVYYAPEENY